MQTHSQYKKEPQLIWYNPDLEIYQSGSETDFERSAQRGYNQSGFTIVHEYTKTPATLVHRVVNSLNSMHNAN